MGRRRFGAATPPGTPGGGASALGAWQRGLVGRSSRRPSGRCFLSVTFRIGAGLVLRNRPRLRLGWPAATGGRWSAQSTSFCSHFAFCKPNCAVSGGSAKSAAPERCIDGAVAVLGGDRVFVGGWSSASGSPRRGVRCSRRTARPGQIRSLPWSSARDGDDTRGCAASPTAGLRSRCRCASSADTATR
jgi:hypothetical protein